MTSGKTFLHIAGVILIAYGGIGIVSSAWSLVTADGILWSIHYASVLASSFFYIFVGIVGILNRTCLEKASILRALGGVVIGSVVFSALFRAVLLANTLGGLVVLHVVITLVYGLVIPVTYTIGAQKNLKDYTP